jgi:hypothetical protein
MRRTDGWRGSRWRSYTACGRAGPTATTGSPINQPVPRRWRSENAASPICRAGPAICVDTVHQGDLDRVKGLYHINALDEVTQWQVVGATAQILEACCCWC